MKFAGSIAAAAATSSILLTAVAWAADDGNRPFGGPPPQRNTEERPFGGPPPSDRKIQFKKRGKKCRTTVGLCELVKGRAVGTACTCPDGDSSGAQGKVE
jgi:hypothetical protein